MFLVVLPVPLVLMHAGAALHYHYWRHNDVLAHAAAIRKHQ
jgi:hypothetical protein